MDWNSRRVLVTGGAGFIGSHLVDALLARGARVRVLDNLSNGKRENLAHCEAEIEFLEADIRDAAACRAAVRDVEYVFHQAALGSVPRSMKDPSTSIAVNVSGTANVFAAARDEGARRSDVGSGDRGLIGASAKRERGEGPEQSKSEVHSLSCWS